MRKKDLFRSFFLDAIENNEEKEMNLNFINSAFQKEPINDHKIIVNSNGFYKLVNKNSLPFKKLNLATILNTLYQEVQKKDLKEQELKQALKISNYFVKKYESSNTPVWVNKIKNIFCRFFNWILGNGFQTSLEIAKNIQQSLISKRAVSIGDAFKFPEEVDLQKYIPRKWYGFQFEQDRGMKTRYERSCRLVNKHLAPLSLNTPNVSAITYNFTGGRFGDNLLSYLKGKYASLQFGIPLLFKPFEFSDQFAFSKLETNISSEMRNKFTNHVTYKKSLDFDDLQNDSRTNSTLYSLPWDDYYEADWDNVDFLTKVQPFVRLQKEFPQWNLPKDRISVALHVRTGEGFDCKWDVTGNPTKFLEESFYIEALKKVQEYYKNGPLYVYLFTDDPNPNRILETYKTHFSQSNLVFDCRKEENAHNLNILEDWSALLQFQVLIRPDSSFSYTAEILGKNHISLFPRINVEQAKKRILQIDVGLRINPATNPLT